MAWKRETLFLLAFTCIAIPFVHAQQRSLQVAALRPQQLLWQRTSPSLQKPEGPVLYQLLFSASGTPGTLAKFDNNPRHLINSDITDNGDLVTFGSSGLTIDASTGIINFVNTQPLPGGPFLSLAGGTLTGPLSGTSAGFSGDLSANNITANGTFSGNGSALTNVNAAQLNGQPASFYQQRVNGVCPVGTSVVSVNANGTVVCGATTAIPPLYSSTPNVITVLDNTANAGIFTSITIGADGLPITSYGGIITGSTHNLAVVHCTALDCSTHGPVTVVDNSPNSGGFSSITIGTDGLPIISYTGNGGSPNLSVVHCTAIDCTTHGPVTVLDNTPNAGLSTSIAIGKDGLPIISYGSIISGTTFLSAVHCTVLDCSTHDSPVVLDSTPNPGGNFYLSMAIGNDGFPLISYTGFTGSGYNLNAMHCSATDCSTHDSPLVLDNTAGAGFYSSLTIGIDGLPVISYQGNSSSLNLSVVHCSVANCSSHGPNFVPDNAPNIHVFTAITIGSDGLPLISYNGISGGINNLSTVHCASVDCSTHAAPTILDSAPGAGGYSSVTIGSDGLPIMSYRGFSGGHTNLSVLHCSNILCAPPYVRRR